jgi:hypothetical protein
LETNWFDWGILAIVMTVAFLLPFVIGKYIGVHIKLAEGRAGASFAKSTSADGS